MVRKITPLVLILFLMSCERSSNNLPIINLPSVLEVLENQTQVSEILVSDPDDDPLQITISGIDKDFFLVEDRILSFTEAPDFEAREEFFITLVVDDTHHVVIHDLKIIVLNVNDNPPFFVSLETDLFARNGNLDLGTISSEDPDNDLLAYSIDGHDSEFLFCDPESGELSFIAPPDFTVRSTYEIVATVFDGIHEVSKPLTIYELVLPQILISTSDQIVDEPKIMAEMEIFKNNTLVEYYNIGIELRGSSSLAFSKKSYGFETRDAEDEDLSTSLGGFPEEEDWILYGPFLDKSLLRNVLIFDLSNSINRYASRTAFYELFINNEARGLYVLMEKMKRDKNRIDVSKNNDADISGGYILQIDRPTSTNGEPDISEFFYSLSTIDNTRPIAFLYEYPKSNKITEEQKSYIQDYINNFEQALLSEDFEDANSGYQHWIDTDSFVDFFLLTELSKNVDGYRLSTFLHKEKGEKLKMGPIWDFNSAFGLVSYCGAFDVSGWQYQFNSLCPQDYQVPFWISRLLESSEFKQRAKNRWLALRSNELSNFTIISKLNAYTRYLGEYNAIARNLEYHDHDVGAWGAISQPTYSGDINYLKNWIEGRLTWIDSEIALW